MASKDIELAARRIMSLVNSCPSVCFFVTDAILKVLKHYVEIGHEVAWKAVERSNKTPRSFLNVLAMKAIQENSILNRGTLPKTKTLIHDLLTLKKRPCRETSELIRILEELNIEEDLETFQMPDRVKKSILRHIDELKEAQKQAKKLLKCAVKNLPWEKGKT